MEMLLSTMMTTTTVVVQVMRKMMMMSNMLKENVLPREMLAYTAVFIIQHGMGGNRNQQSNNQNRNDVPFAKVKFTIPSFSRAYDADAYLDWEMTVEQKFNSHLVPEVHRVRQATSEFKDFAIIWWNELVNQHLQPDSWARLKDAM
jgi:hypothetical protein